MNEYESLVQPWHSDLSSAGTATNLFAYGAAGLAQRRNVSASATYNYSFDPSGNVVQRHTAGASTLADFTTLYDGFGQQMGNLDTNTGSQASAACNEMIGFAGQYGCWTDNETYTTASGGAPQRRFPWVWMGHREYDPLAARFLTRDPIDYDGGINLYAYCGNNPIMFADPSGLQQTGEQISEKNQAKIISYIPSSPKNTNLFNNIKLAKKVIDDFATDALLVEGANFLMSVGLGSEDAYKTGTQLNKDIYAGRVLGWFAKQVQHKGPWDYKQFAKPGNQNQFDAYDDLGNFNYGAVGASMGLDLETLQMAGGFAKQGSNIKAMLKHQEYRHDAEGIPLILFPYGDDRRGQLEIIRGYEWYQKFSKWDSFRKL